MASIAVGIVQLFIEMFSLSSVVVDRCWNHNRKLVAHRACCSTCTGWASMCIAKPDVETTTQQASEIVAVSSVEPVTTAD